MERLAEAKEKAEMFNFGRKRIKQFAETKEIFGNPLMGYAKNAWHTEVAEDITLLYMDITWAELEPEEGTYDWDLIEKKNQITRWKKEGKHLILRFVCDVPGEEKHMDIPKWLYEKSGEAGKWYDCSYGKGFAPDYQNIRIVSSHEKAVRALGKHLGQDGLISYIELGSLGHWGEWHVNYGIGIQRLPEERIREKYVAPWIEAFPDTKILMRRPFSTAGKYGLGLYNDMAGDTKETEIWLRWISEGGRYEQTGEEMAMVPMEDFWKKAPSGGEIASSVPMSEMMQENLSKTVSLLQDSHTTFLGPMIPDVEYAEGYVEILKNIGYRLWISKAELRGFRKETSLRLVWENSGVAPLYQDWAVYIYMEDDGEKVIGKQKVNMNISAVFPGEELVTETALNLKDFSGLLEKGYRLAIGIEDPVTGMPCIRLAMDVLYKDGKNYLW